MPANRDYKDLFRILNEEILEKIKEGLVIQNECTSA